LVGGEECILNVHKNFKPDATGREQQRVIQLATAVLLAKPFPLLFL
jgi:hypothetical protein